MHLRETVIAEKGPLLSIAEYLALEKPSLEKHEFLSRPHDLGPYGGIRHAVVIKNVFCNMAMQLSGTLYQPFNSDMRLHIPENTLFTYPDISIYSEEFAASEHDEDTAVRPIVLVEILSLATIDYDRGNKFKLYRDIPTLREYVLIDSSRIGIEVWRINGEGILAVGRV